ncbi:MAG: hypothetical protein MUC41_03665 [Syntrophobacteraceae bacterium]|nr:hypothetical protein [Syntrophobacteraceae bacterium]
MGIVSIMSGFGMGGFRAGLNRVARSGCRRSMRLTGRGRAWRGPLRLLAGVLPLCGSLRRRIGCGGCARRNLLLPGALRQQGVTLKRP